jgi:hypothetical protein
VTKNARNTGQPEPFDKLRINEVEGSLDFGHFVPDARREERDSQMIAMDYHLGRARLIGPVILLKR